MDEFDLIQSYLAPLAGAEGLGLLDDAALYKPPSGFDLVLAKDTMVEGVHFPKGHYGGDTAERLLRVNLSDLAAKAARPVGYLLSIAWPQSADPKYFKGFAKGLSDVQSAYDFTLFGGDTVAIDGPMVVTASFVGAVPKGQMVLRSGANIGDDVWVSGTIGDAYLGMKYVTGQSLHYSPNGDDLWHWEEAYLRPEPRLLMRKLLRSYATSAVDVSDGLIADIMHLSKASDVSIHLEMGAVKLSNSTKKWLKNQTDNRKSFIDLMTAGDDYEIVFCANPKDRKNIENKAKELSLRLTRIGDCHEGDEVRVSRGGEVLDIVNTGYRHL